MKCLFVGGSLHGKTKEVPDEIFKAEKNLWIRPVSGGTEIYLPRKASSIPTYVLHTVEKE